MTTRLTRVTVAACLAAGVLAGGGIAQAQPYYCDEPAPPGIPPGTACTPIDPVGAEPADDPAPGEPVPEPVPAPDPAPGESGTQDDGDAGAPTDQTSDPQGQIGGLFALFGPMSSSLEGLFLGSSAPTANVDSPPEPESAPLIIRVQ